jgi:hypothetical protein
LHRAQTFTALTFSKSERQTERPRPSAN